MTPCFSPLALKAFREISVFILPGQAIVILMLFFASSKDKL
jgi:hypothetical protein